MTPAAAATGVAEEEEGVAVNAPEESLGVVEVEEEVEVGVGVETVAVAEDAMGEAEDRVTMEEDTTAKHCRLRGACKIRT